LSKPFFTYILIARYGQFPMRAIGHGPARVDEVFRLDCLGLGDRFHSLVSVKTILVSVHISTVYALFSEVFLKLGDFVIEEFLLSSESFGHRCRLHQER